MDDVMDSQMGYDDPIPERRITKPSSGPLQTYSKEEIVATGPVFPDPGALGFMKRQVSLPARPYPKYMLIQSRLLETPPFHQNEWDRQNQEKMVKMEEKNNGSDFQGLYEEFQKMRDVERSKMEELGLVDAENQAKDLNDAIYFQGTCLDMCPTFERVRRALENNVKALEKDFASQKISRARAVKAFSRPAAGQPPPMPSDVRPPHILIKTLDYLIGTILPQLPDSHSFLWDRTRSIRQDFVYQNYYGAEAIDCNERIVRIHLLSMHVMAAANVEYSQQQELEQFNKALQTLMELYQDVRNHGGHCPNEAEFRAYHLLSHFRDPELEREIQTLPKSIFMDLRVQLALRFRLLMSQNVTGERGQTGKIGAANLFVKFFELVHHRSTPFLMACLLETHFNEVRFYALKALSRSYHTGGKALLGTALQLMLGFDSLQELVNFVSYYEVDTFNDDQGILLVDLCNKEKLENVYKLKSISEKPKRSPAFSLKVDARLREQKIKDYINSGLPNNDLRIRQTALTPVLHKDVKKTQHTNTDAAPIHLNSQAALSLAPITGGFGSNQAQVHASSFGSIPIANSLFVVAATQLLQSGSFNLADFSNANKANPTQSNFGQSFIPTTTKADSMSTATPTSKSTFGLNQAKPNNFGLVVLSGTNSEGQNETLMPLFGISKNSNEIRNDQNDGQRRFGNENENENENENKNKNKNENENEKKNENENKSINKGQNFTFGNTKGLAEFNYPASTMTRELTPGSDKLVQIETDKPNGGGAHVHFASVPEVKIIDQVSPPQTAQKSIKNSPNYNTAMTSVTNSLISEIVAKEVNSILSNVGAATRKAMERQKIIDLFSVELLLAFLSEVTYQTTLKSVADCTYRRNLLKKVYSLVQQLSRKALARQKEKESRLNELQSANFKAPSLKRELASKLSIETQVKRRKNHLYDTGLTDMLVRQTEIKTLWEPLQLTNFATDCALKLGRKARFVKDIKCMLVVENWSLPYSKWLANKFSLQANQEKTNYINAVQTPDLNLTFESLSKATLSRPESMETTTFIVYECGLTDESTLQKYKDLGTKLNRDRGILDKIIQMCNRYCLFKVHILVLMWDASHNQSSDEQLKQFFNPGRYIGSNSCVESMTLCNMGIDDRDVGNVLEYEFSLIIALFTGTYTARGERKLQAFEKRRQSLVVEKPKEDISKVEDKIQSREQDLLRKAKLNPQHHGYLSKHIGCNTSIDLTNTTGVFKTPNASFRNRSMHYNSSFLGNRSLLGNNSFSSIGRDNSFFKSFVNGSILEESTPSASPRPDLQALPKKIQDLRRLTASIKEKYRK